MPKAFSTTLSAVPVRPRRGRPLGSIKDDQARLRDRIRVVATLNELLMRVTTVENANQFARWFDGIMRKQHPLLPWETEQSGKWRKNFAGSVALNPESIEHLQELFPDNRYYSAVGLCGRKQETRVALHRLVPADRGYFLVAQASFNKPANGLVTQVMKTEIDQPCTLLDPVPDFRELVRAPFLVAARLSEKHQVGVDWPNGVGESAFQD